MGQHEIPKRKKGKYLARNNRTRQRRRRAGTHRLLLGVLLLVALLLAVCIAYMLSSIKAQRDFEALSAMVGQQETVMPTASTEEETMPDSEEISILETTEPVSTEPRMLKKYAPLYEQNPDIAGWLRIEDTVLDYPVMYTPEDPEKYLHRNFDGEYSYSGVPFIEDSCGLDSDNLIIYGHNMSNGSMFRELFQYENKSYWEQHPTIRFDTLYEEREYEVLAAFYDRVYYTTEDVFKFYKFIDADSEEDFNCAVEQFRGKALYDTGADAQYGDRLITLVTCAYHVDNGRFVVVARWSPAEE